MSIYIIWQKQETPGGIWAPDLASSAEGDLGSAGSWWNR